MTQIREQWVCKLCAERNKIPARKKSSKGIGIWVVAALLAVGLAAGIYFRDSIKEYFGEKREPWANKPPSEWPLMVGANVTVELPQQFIPTRNAFIIDPDDEVFMGATTVMLNGSANPSADPASSSAQEFQFKTWTILEGANASPLVFQRLRAGSESALKLGVVLLSSQDGIKPRSLTPLKLRKAKTTGNTRLFVIAANDAGGQTVHPVRAKSIETADQNSDFRKSQTLPQPSNKSGATVPTGDGSRSVLEFEQLAVLKGVLGAPVLDELGHVVAIVTGSPSTRDPESQTLQVTAFGMNALQTAVGTRK